MAEANKRNSMAAKVATPKAPATPVATPTQSTIDPMEAIFKSIGARVKLTTAAMAPMTLEGTLYTADTTFNVVAIDVSSASTAPSEASRQPSDIHMIPISKIQSFQVLALAPGVKSGNSSFASAQPPIAPVDVDRVNERVKAKVRELQEAKKHIGQGVTPEAQAIYDALKRINVPVRWHNEQIIVHDKVIVAPPYNVEDCRGPTKDSATIERVKKVLEGERRKLKEKEEQERKAATPVGPRKGG